MAKKDGKTARRYARALCEASKREDLDGLKTALEDLCALWSDKSVQAFCLNPAIPSAAKQDLMKDAAAHIKPGDSNFCNFLLLLAENGRFALINEIREVFFTLVDEINQTAAVEVVSASELNGDEKEDITRRLAETLGQRLAISWTVDETLLGGLLIKVGDRQLDSSLRGALEKAAYCLTV